MNWAAARLTGLSPETPGLTYGGNIQGVTSHGLRSVLHDYELGVGKARKARFSVRIADLPVFTTLGFTEGAPAMILGIDALADRRFIIDHPGKRLYISSLSVGGQQDR
jgi:hypothetical protein